MAEPYIFITVRGEIQFRLVSEGANHAGPPGLEDFCTKCNLFSVDPAESQKPLEDLIAQRGQLAVVIRTLIARLDAEGLCNGNGQPYELAA